MKRRVDEVIGLLQKTGLLTKVSLGTLSEDTALSDITYDNRSAREGCLFICKGAAFKKEYLIDAFERGASLYIAEEPLCQELPYLAVSDNRRTMSYLGALFFEDETRDLVKIGITGTKGKTTVSILLHAILDCFSMERHQTKSGLLSSLYIENGRDKLESKLTTPEAIELWHHLAEMKRNRLSFVTCEVSSQALRYHRVSDVSFDQALFLNIGNDHISEAEHPDFQDYFSAKLSIFDLARRACINSSSDRFGEVIAAAKGSGCEIYTFGFQPTDTLFCEGYEHTEGKTRFTVSYMGYESEEYEILLLGKHNVENALAAILSAKLLSVPDDCIREGLLFAEVEGRGVELATEDRRVRVIVDYAHNGMSLEAVYRYVESAYPEYRVITLFGCPGGKGMNRREDMGKIAGKNSDLVLITEDDPAKEPLLEICQSVAAYVEREGTPYEIIPDRGQAIVRAFSLCQDKTVILLCGKGVEKTQKRATGDVPYEGDLYFAQEGIAAYDRSLLPIG